MKKLFALVFLLCFSMTSLCYADESLEDFSKRAEGKWEVEDEVITIPSEEVIFTENSKGVVYMSILMDDSLSYTAMVTISSDNDVMVLIDTDGSAAVLKRVG